MRQWAKGRIALIPMGMVLRCGHVSTEIHYPGDGTGWPFLWVRSDLKKKAGTEAGQGGGGLAGRSLNLRKRETPTEKQGMRGKRK